MKKEPDRIRNSGDEAGPFDFSRAVRGLHTARHYPGGSSKPRRITPAEARRLSAERREFDEIHRPVLAIVRFPAGPGSVPVFKFVRATRELEKKPLKAGETRVRFALDEAKRLIAANPTAKIVSMVPGISGERGMTVPVPIEEKLYQQFATPESVNKALKSYLRLRSHPARSIKIP